MIFSYRKLFYLTNFKIGSATIEETNNIKLFWIIFDKHLTFKHHVDVIAQKISESSSSSSSRTDRWVYFQQNAGLRLFVHT